jgi:ubiquinone biosynthesis protein
LHTLAALLERAIPETKIYSPAGLVDQFDQAITAELDFVQEGENARRFRQNFTDHPEVVFPTVYRDASSKQVITLSFLEGDKFEDAIKKGHDGKALAKLTFRTMVKQIYEDGFFHADPHPGNVLIQGTPEAPRLALFDLGMVGRMSPRMRDLTIDVVTAALRRDTDAMAMALYEIGTPTKKIDMEAYKLEVALLSEKLLGRSLGEVDVGELLRDLVRAATKYGITIPTDFLLMGKALVTIEGVGKEIDPDFDLMEEAQPLFADLLRKRYSPERIGTDLWRRLERLGGVGYRVPQQLEEVLEDVRLGRLTITTQSPDHARALGRAARHLASSVVVAALAVGAALLFAVHRDEVAWVFVGVSVLSTGYQLLAGVWSHFGKP